MPRLYLPPPFQINCLTKHPRVFTARLKPPATGDPCVCGVGARAGAASEGHGPSWGAAQSRRPPHCRAQEPASPCVSGWASPVKQCRTAEVCLPWCATFVGQALCCFPHHPLPPLRPPWSCKLPAFLTCFWGTCHQPEGALYPPHCPPRPAIRNPLTIHYPCNLIAIITFLEKSWKRSTG